MKLRLLNASHQAMCYLGYLAGHRYAHEVCQDPLFVRFLMRYMDQEATPTLAPVPGVDLTAYKRTLVERFANPHVRDTLSRLVRHARERPGAGLLGVEMVDGDGQVDPASRRSDPSLVEQLLRFNRREDLYLGRDPARGRPGHRFLPARSAGPASRCRQSRPSAKAGTLP